MVPLGIAFFSEAKLPGTFNPERFAYHWTSVLDSGSGLVAGYFDDSGTLRGGAGVYLVPDVFTTDTVAYEAFFYIEPAFRGSGTALLSTLEQEAASKGADRLWMIHLNDDKASIMKRYYQRRGFELREFLYLKQLK